MLSPYGDTHDSPCKLALKVQTHDLHQVHDSIQIDHKHLETLMDEILSSFLHEKKFNTTNLSSKLSKNQDAVILSFGGLTNMIELCLTNPSASEYINLDSQQFDSFTHLFMMKNNDDHDIDNSKANANNTQMNVSKTDVIISDDSNNNINKNNNNINNNTILKPIKTLTTNDIAEYRHSKLIIDFDPNNNSLFKLIDDENIRLWLYEQILSKKLFSLLCLCLSFIFIISLISVYIFSSTGTVYLICSIIWTFLTSSYAISMILISNISVIQLITNTFDFWFKVYSLAIFLGSWWINICGINYDNNKQNDSNNDVYRFDKIGIDGFFGEIFIQIGYIVVLVAIFLLDAIPVSIKVKRISIIILVIVATNGCIFYYFNAPDFEWNPFKNKYKYSQISFKSIVLSSYVNLILFIVKPVCSDLLRYLKSVYVKCQKTPNMNISLRNNTSSDNINTNTNTNYQRCGTMYKRPYLRINKIHTNYDPS